MNECDYFRQLEEAADDGLPQPIDDIDLEQKYEEDHAELNWESDPECLRIIDDQVRRIFNE